MDIFKDIDKIVYKIEEEGEVNTEDLVSFANSLDYDSELKLTVYISDLKIILEINPTWENKYSVTIFTNETENFELEIPKTVTTFKAVVESLITYLKINY